MVDKLIMFAVKKVNFSNSTKELERIKSDFLISDSKIGYEKVEIFFEIAEVLDIRICGSYPRTLDGLKPQI